MSNYKLFCVRCTQCSGTTSKTYARAHNGLCKACVTGEQPKAKENASLLCPTCREHYLTPYQKANRYHCDSCTREADPMGYYRELTTPYQGDY